MVTNLESYEPCNLTLGQLQSGDNFCDNFFSSRHATFLNVFCDFSMLCIFLVKNWQIAMNFNNNQKEMFGKQETNIMARRNKVDIETIVYSLR